MSANYKNVAGAVMFEGTTSYYNERFADSWIQLILAANYAGPAVFDVYSCPPAANGTPNTGAEAKIQFAAPNCPGYSQNAAGDLQLKLSAKDVAPAADQIGVKTGVRIINVRLPMMPGNHFVTLKANPANAETAKVQALLMHDAAVVR
ncbi:MAG: hypothetical protein AB7F96_16400 [Beijerinckiaceae bacterium]